MTIIIVVALVSILLSGFFSGTEIAFFSLNEAKIHSLVKKKVKGAKLLEKLKSNPERLLVTILIGNNIVNIGSSSLITSLVTQQYGSQAVGVATGMMIFLVLTFGEIVPKSIATTYSSQIARYTAFPIYLFQITLLPISFLFELISKFTLKIVSRGKKEEESTEEDLLSIAAIGYKKGTLEAHEHKVIRKILKLNDTRVSKVMTSKENMYVINGEDTLNTVIKKIKENHYSRLPVYLENTDNIVGFLITKDIISFPKYKWSELKVKDIMRKVLFVKDNMLLSELYPKLQTEKLHLAIVQDKTNNTVGLITLENIIEELLGEIYDETDDHDDW